MSIPFINWIAHARGLDAFSGGGTVMLLALPAIALSRISTGASRGMLVIGNEFYSRGLAETWVTTLVFLVALAVGLRGDGALAWPSSAAVRPAPQSRSCWLAEPSKHARGSVEAGRPALGEILRFSSRIAGSDLLSVLVLQADVLLLGAYVGRAPGVTLASFGVFCAAAELAGGMRKVRQVFDPIFAPIVATRAVSDDRAALRDTVAGPGRWVLSAQLPLVGVSLLASGTVMSIYGAGFRQGALWLALLALAHGANTFAGLVETLLMIERPGLEPRSMRASPWRFRWRRASS